MSIGMSELCAWLRNWFEPSPPVRILDAYTVKDGELTSLKLAQKAQAGEIADGDYIRVVGSRRNNGVYTYPPTGLQDETFRGAVWLMSIPPEVHTLLTDINSWTTKYQASDSQSDSPFQSESFGGYSYSKATSGSATNGSADNAAWYTAFASRLNRWRKTKV